MAIDVNFLGLSLEFEQSLSQLQGITLELTENLIVKVLDSEGQPVNGAKVFFTIGVETETGVTQDAGSFGYFVENQATVTVFATYECLTTETVDILHNGEDDFKSITLTLSELPCLDPDPLNDYNFIRWQLSNNLKFPLEELPIQECAGCAAEGGLRGLIGLQRPTKDTDCEDYLPKMKNGEQYSFFTNFQSNIIFQDKANLRIALLKDGDLNFTQSYEVQFISKTIVSSQYDYFFTSFTPENVAKGKYRLAVYNQSSNSIILLSNLVDFNDNVDVQTTALVKYRNNDDIDGFQYLDLPDYYNQIRIDIFTDQAREPEQDFEDEDQVATAEHRYISLAHRLAIPVVAAQLDDKACNALESMLAHNEVYINGKRYNCKPEVDYEQADETHNLYDGRFQVYDYSYARKNKYR